MPRKYDRLIRFYDSWFGDLQDPTKEFTPVECWSIILAVRECQVQGSLEPLEQLPLSIRRALSMATMGEQIERILERIDRRRDISKHGGDTAAANRRSPEQIAAAKIRAEKEAKETAEKEAAYQEQRKRATQPNKYLELLKQAAAGDQAALDELKTTPEAAAKALQNSYFNKKGGKA